MLPDLDAKFAAELSKILTFCAAFPGITYLFGKALLARYRKNAELVAQLEAKLAQEREQAAHVLHEERQKNIKEWLDAFGVSLRGCRDELVHCREGIASHERALLEHSDKLEKYDDATEKLTKDMTVNAGRIESLVHLLRGISKLLAAPHAGTEFDRVGDNLLAPKKKATNDP